MRQITAKTLVEALEWINANAHQEVGTEYHRTQTDDEGLPLRTHIYYANHHEKLRVPMDLANQVAIYTVANPRAFDTRMFAVTRAGKRLIADAA